MKLKNTIMIAAIVVAGLVAALFITRTGKSGAVGDPHGDHGGHSEDEEQAKGPHGGKLFSEGDFRVEVTIYEKGVPPQFRVYAYEKDKNVNPEEVKLTIELHRLGGRGDRISVRE